MGKWDGFSFEWKQIDEKVLHFSRPAKIQLIYEICIIGLPLIMIDIIILSLWIYFSISWWILWLTIFIITFIGVLSILYKMYRTKRNYIIITSKRIIFHGIKWLFNDYMKKIHYENIINVNYFTQNLVWKIFKYWTLEIQTSHSWLWDITMYNIENWKMLTHYIDKVISISQEERNNFWEFNPRYFKEG